MKSEPLYRRPLNEKQLAILHLLYKFRFATTELLSISLNTKDKSKMNKRMTILTDQGYVGRKYEPSYRLRGQHASFHLLSSGIKALKELPDNKYASAVLHAAYKDKTASDRFINHSLNIFDTFCQLKNQYGDRLRIFTKAELTPYEYFPQPLPDLYLRLDSSDNEKQFLVDLVDDAQPKFVQIKRVKQYVEYSEEGDWEDATSTELPTMLLVCESVAAKKKLDQLIARVVEDFDEDDTPLQVVAKEHLVNILDTKKEGPVVVKTPSLRF